MSNNLDETNTEYRYYIRRDTRKLLRRNMYTDNVMMWDIDYQYMSRGFMMPDNEPSNVPDVVWILNVPEKYR